MFLLFQRNPGFPALLYLFLFPPHLYCVSTLLSELQICLHPDTSPLSANSVGFLTYSSRIKQPEAHIELILDAGNLILLDHLHDTVFMCLLSIQQKHTKMFKAIFRQETKYYCFSKTDEKGRKGDRVRIQTDCMFLT